MKQKKGQQQNTDKGHRSVKSKMVHSSKWKTKKHQDIPELLTTSHLWKWNQLSEKTKEKKKGKKNKRGKKGNEDAEAPPMPILDNGGREGEPSSMIEGNDAEEEKKRYR